MSVSRPPGRRRTALSDKGSYQTFRPPDRACNFVLYVLADHDLAGATTRGRRMSRELSRGTATSANLQQACGVLLRSLSSRKRLCVGKRVLGDTTVAAAILDGLLHYARCSASTARATACASTSQRINRLRPAITAGGNLMITPEESA